MAIDLTGIPVVDTDFLKSGFRVKFNMAVDKMVNGVSITDGSKLRIRTKDNSFVEVDLSEYFYTIEDINELFFVAYATEEKAGKIRIGTLEEVMELEDTTVAVTPYTLGQLLYYYNGKGYVAMEDLLAGDFVCIFFDEEELDEEIQWKVKKAIANSKDTLCRGFVVEDTLLGDVAPVKLSGNINDNLGDLVPYQWYYLRDVEPDVDEPLQISTEKPSDVGTYVQQIGYAISETELMVELHPDEINLGEVFENLPHLVFIKDVDMTVSMFLEDYLIEGIDPESLSFEFKGLPDWISNTQVIFNDLAFTGRSDEVGFVYVDMIVTSGNSTVTITLVLETIEAPKAVFTLTPGGEIPKGSVSIYEGSTAYDLDINIASPYQAYQVKVNGPSVSYDSGFEEGTMPSSTIFSGNTLSDGMYKAEVDIYRQTGYDLELEEAIYTKVSTEIRTFVIGKNLGEGDSDHIINAIISPYNAELSSAGSVFEHDPNGVNISFEPVGIVFTKLKATLVPNENPYYVELFPSKTNVTGSITNEIINTTTGVAAPDSSWRATSMSVTPGDRYWSDGAFFLYDGSLFVSYHPAGEIVIPAGITTMRTNKETTAQTVESVEFNDFEMFANAVDKGIGDFSIMLETEGDSPYQRLVSWTINEALPEPPVAKAGLKLINSANGSIVGNIPLTGGVFMLPVGGFNVLCQSFSSPVDFIEWTHERDRGGWAEVNILTFTGKNAFKSFDEAISSVNQLAFWNKNSQDIGTIHEAPSRHRTTFKGYFEDELTEIIQGDYHFSNTPIGAPSGLDFLNIVIDDLGSGDEVISASAIVSNIPETGGVYPIPSADKTYWSANKNTYDSVTTFKRVVHKVNGIVVSDYLLSAPTATMSNTEVLELLMWDRSSGVDTEGEKVFVQEFYDEFDILIGDFQSTFLLYKEEPEIKDPTECCDDKCDGPYFTVHDW